MATGGVNRAPEGTNPVNLERHIKRRLLAPPQRAVVHPAPGCAPSAISELSDLLARLETPGEVRATLRESPAGIALAPIRYRSLLELVMRLTTVQDVSLVIGEGAVHNRRDLEGLLEGLDWEFYLRSGDEAFLRCDSRASSLYHEGILREVASERLSRLGVRPVAGEGSEGAHTLTIRIYRNRCVVLVSLAGAPLWKRGYRISPYAPAPLREDLAQSAIRWTLEGNASRPTTGRSPVPAHDLLFLPFSGSGTLLFEYLLARFGVPPFVFRAGYAFERFALLPPSVAWAKERLLDRLAVRLSEAQPLEACLVDRDGAAGAAAGENLRRFETLLGSAGSGLAGTDSGVRGSIGLPLRVERVTADVFARPWREWLPAASERVFLAMNPPYGVRLAARSVDELFRKIGGATAELAAGLPPGGLSGFVLCPSEGSWRGFLAAAPGLAVATTHLSHGGLDIRLCRFAS